MLINHDKNDFTRFAKTFLLTLSSKKIIMPRILNINFTSLPLLQCRETKRKRAIIRQFELSRQCIKNFGRAGSLTGLRKSKGY